MERTLWISDETSSLVRALLAPRLPYLLHFGHTSTTERYIYNSLLDTLHIGGPACIKEYIQGKLGDARY